MNAPAQDIHLTFSAEGSNADAYLGEGWHSAEVGHRWTDGLASVVRLPPMRARPWFALSLHCWPVTTGGVTQRLRVWLNGAELKRFDRVDLALLHIVVPGALVNEAADNVLVLDHPDAVRPNEIDAAERDGRLLSLSFQSLGFETLDEPLHLSPRLLARAAPPARAADVKSLVEVFQSLGHNHDLGLFQRAYGAEPNGLLRFAAIGHDPLLRALKSRFAGIGDLDKLSFHVEPDGRQMRGRHAVYGLDYQTSMPKEQTNVAELAAREAMRLKYLARLLCEQLERDEKIFVRHESFETPEKALALHHLMRSYNRRVRLLLIGAAPSQAPERVGRVIELRPGLYRGYLPKLPDPDRPVYEAWLSLCAAVAAHERARAGASSSAVP